MPLNRAEKALVPVASRTFSPTQAGLQPAGWVIPATERDWRASPAIGAGTDLPRSTSVEERSLAIMTEPEVPKEPSVEDLEEARARCLCSSSVAAFG
jgi:hypothetical protein